MKRLLTSICLAWTLVCGQWPTANAQGIPFIRNFSASEYRGHNQNFDIITGNDGTVYVANFEGLLYYNNASWNIIHTPGVTRITSVFRDSKGTIWTGGYNYIGYTVTTDNGSIALKTIDEAKNFQGEVQWIWEKNGVIFFKGSDNKIYSVRNDVVSWAAGEKLPQSGFSVLVQNAHITQVQELEEGLKAVATNGNGIIIVNSKDQELFCITEKNGLCSNNVAHITYNKHGIIWGATDNGIFAIGFPSIYTHFTSFENLKGEVLGIETLNGRTYAGTLSGVFELKEMSFEPLSSITHACWQLKRMGNTLLAATSNGLYRISGDNKVQQLSDANTLSLLVVDNAFYSGEMDGVYYNTPEIRKKVSDVEKVVKMVRGHDGIIWMQNMYGKLWKNFALYTQGGLEDEMATVVNFYGRTLPIATNTTKPFSYPTFDYTDQEGIMWLTNAKGKKLYAFNQQGKDANMSSYVYPLMDFSFRALKRNGNLLWIGGDKGINIVDLSRNDPAKTMQPRVIIRKVMIHGDSVVWGGYGQQPEMLPNLSSDTHHMSIEFSTDYPSLLLKTQYRNRLNGNKWSSWDTDAFEEFANLSPGSYTFEVQARDAFGQVSNIATIRFVVMQPFYLRWYMIILYLLIAAGLAYRLMQWRTYRLEKEKHQLENLVKERTNEVVRLEKMATAGKLTQGLIDRILNPLNYINNFAKLSEGLVGDAKANIEDEQEHMDPDNYEDTIDVLDMLKGNLQKVGEHGASTSRTLKAMEEMLKDRSGGIVEMDLTALLHQDEDMMKKYFEKEISQYHISTVFNIPGEKIMINGNGEQLSKTFMNMLGNSIYAIIKKVQRTQFEPEVRMDVKHTGKVVTIHLRDNGIGIESTILEKIFDPFFTTKTTGEASGIGLYICREIAQNHGGDISVSSEKDVYTEFTITLPTL